MRKLIVASLAAALMAGAAIPALARVDLYVDVAPPPPRVEVVPAPRPGYVWVAGGWVWRGHHHVWTRGHWVAERRGYVYEPAIWVSEGGRWRYRPGSWRHH
jgi:hypothetical protein